MRFFSSFVNHLGNLKFPCRVKGTSSDVHQFTILSRIYQQTVEIETLKLIIPVYVTKVLSDLIKVSFFDITWFKIRCLGYRRIWLFIQIGKDRGAGGEELGWLSVDHLLIHLSSVGCWIPGPKSYMFSLVTWFRENPLVRSSRVSAWLVSF